MDSIQMDQETDILRHLCRPVSFLTPERVVHPQSWLGHVPFAFWIIEALKPATLVELGVHSGNSYSAFCQAIKRLQLPTACYGVDTWQGDPQAGQYGDDIYQDLADHHDPRYGSFSRLLRMTFDEAVGGFADGSIDLLHIDGLHTYDAVRHDFETWLPKMSRRGVILFHDTNVRRDDFGVWRLWEDLTATYPSFTFLHSNGLGALGVGEEVPDGLAPLFAAQKAGGPALENARLFFERLGDGVVETRIARANAEHAGRLEGHIEVLDDKIRHQGQVIDNQNENIGALRAVVADREYRIGLRQQEIDAQSARFNAFSAQTQQQFQQIYGSTSWRITAPIRKFNRLSHLLRLRHAITLSPIHDVVDDGAGGWKSTGGDPSFWLLSNQRRVPDGWCVLSFRVGRTAETLNPLLYVDCGAGFSESTAIRLPPAAAGVMETVVLLPPGVKSLRFDPANRPVDCAIADFTIQEITRPQALLRALWLYRNRPEDLRDLLRSGDWGAIRLRLLQELMPYQYQGDYASWVRMYDALTAQDRAAIAAAVARMVNPPLISIVMPVYNPPEPYLRRALDTVIDQLYPHWELCVADDASTAPHVAAVLAEYAARDRRIKVTRRDVNGHISAASNSALALATGDFVALMDHDDELPRHALYVVADEISRHPDVDIIYSDEDKIDENGRRHDPYFKPDYDPDLLHGQNMFNHLSVFRRSLMTELGGFRPGFEGSQDHDLALRAVEATGADRIRHIPMVLYHWRVFAASSAFSTVALPTAVNAARRALEEHFARRGVAATVEPAPAAPGFSRIRYPLPDPAPRVSLIIPTRDRVGLLRGCVDGILQRTDYPDIEILIVDNDSVEPETRAYFAAVQNDPRVRVLPCPGPFNYSAINNFAAAQATGSLIGLINNDIEVIGPDWLREMASHALRPEVGAVGARLLYADDRVQHAGVALGICGVAGHIHRFAAPDDTGNFGHLVLTRNASCVTAACLVMRKAVFDAVGGLESEHLAVAFNDIDLCLRVREQGLRVIWTPYAELHHLESASRGSDAAADKVHRFMGEIDYMNRRWGDALRRDPCYSPNLTLDAEDLAYAFPPRVVKPWRRDA